MKISEKKYYNKKCKKTLSEKARKIKYLSACILILSVTTVFMIMNSSVSAARASITEQTSTAGVTEQTESEALSPQSPSQPGSDMGVSVLVTPALDILAARANICRWGMAGNDINFSSDDFCRAVNLRQIASITIKSLPLEEFGTLVLGGSKVSVGQVISANNLSLMKYIPADDNVSENSFDFICNTNEYSLTCKIYMLDKMNYAPSTLGIGAAAARVGTYDGITVYGNMYGYDPDSDSMLYEVVEYPENGFLTLGANGSYTYTPSDNFAGKDVFRYVVIDKYGNYSPSQEIELTVSKRKTQAVYTDLDGGEYQSSAVAVTEAGIMSGTQIGDGYYFYPAQTLSRVEFLVMAMNCVGITDVAQVKNTGFTDDDDIAPSMKGYVAAAYRLGYVNGTIYNGEYCFRPDEPITRGEAALILCNIMEVEKKSSTLAVFADSIPSWAQEAVYTMNALGILNTDKDGKIAAYGRLSRGQAAQMLHAVIRIKSN